MDKPTEWFGRTSPIKEEEMRRNPQREDMQQVQQVRPDVPTTQLKGHALSDYQMQLMLLEQQNKERLRMARQEQDNGDILETQQNDRGILMQDAPHPHDPSQSLVLPTISQDLTAGQRHVRDLWMAGLAQKLGLYAGGPPAENRPDDSSFEDEETEFPPPPRVRGRVRRRVPDPPDTKSSFRGYQSLGNEPPLNEWARFSHAHAEGSSAVSGSQTKRNFSAGANHGQDKHQTNGLSLRTRDSIGEDLSEDDRSIHGNLEAGVGGRRQIDSRYPGEVHNSSGYENHTKKSQKAPLFETRLGDIDWRSHLCTVLGIDKTTQDSFLLQTIQESGPPGAYFTTLHKVYCQENESEVCYEDRPHQFDPASGKNHLNGQVIAANHELYIERHPGLSFIVYKSYTCCGEDDPAKPKTEAEPASPKESISIVSDHLVESLNKVAKSSTNRHMYPIFECGRRLDAPYPWVFYDRSFLAACIPKLDSRCQTHLQCFEDYISRRMDTEYTEVQSLLSEGLISAKYVPYLFIPGQTVLKRDHKTTDAYDLAFTQVSWPSEYIVKDVEESEGVNEPKQRITLILQGEFWEFDGKFYTDKRSVVLEHETTKGESFPIESLPLFPIQFGGKEKALKLKERGRKLWRCRHRKLMSYTGWDYTQNDHFENARVMIDRQMYSKMHNSISRINEPEISIDTEPPSEDVYLLLPPNTYGYVMRERKWHNIMVEHMSEVSWDKDAFESLVMETSTKELIKALVTSQIDPSQATELMSDKGNGLILLLHGGPGTGKTLTAESVAEYTKKPLYRITCGDIGTTPSEVEKYLNVVLDLGRRWDCVVLLDEAEVFLQERSLEDLARNSLVSVFLRVLEYFQGILILTSNRVATFDEAFKSRIQLALHYEPLGRTQRKQVWQNFIKRLEKVAGSTVDTDDLHRNVDKLAEVNMNGRQIRNAMTTARQLAMFKKQRMDFDILKYIIGVSQKFDEYLDEVNGVTGEQIAREFRIR
ncbi:hypothetical protein IWZ01DRAFT_496099 [Phyllosticta capitalensis]